LLADAVDARWVNNDSIFVDAGKKMLLYSRSGRTAREADREWRMVGRTAAGDVFYTGGNTLYRISGGKEKKIADLPWQCDSVRALSPQGPYLAASAGEDAIFFINGEELVGAGSRSLLPGSQNDGTKESRMSGMTISPDNRYFCVLQQDKDLLSINVITTDDITADSTTADDAPMRKVVLDSWKETATAPDKVGTKWLSGSKLLVYTAQKGWVVSLDEQIEIFQWTEPQGSSIEGVN
jgi:hypothetical protein